MTLGFDEPALLDLRTLATDRALPLAARDRLLRIAAGEGGGNRDLPLWDAAHVILAARISLSATRRPEVKIVEWILDREHADPRTFARLFAPATSVEGWRVAHEGGSVRLEAGQVFRVLHPRQIGFAFALLDLLATADDFSGFAEITALVGDACAGDDGPDSLIKDIARRLSRLFEDWRQRHLAGARFLQHHRAFLQFLASRPGPPSLEYSDTDLFAFWAHQVAGGDRLTFRTCAYHALAFDQILRERSVWSALEDAGDVDAHAVTLADRADDDMSMSEDERIDTAEASDPDDAASMLPALAALARVPDMPKFLTGAERSRIAAVLEFAPWHRLKPLTVLRALVFGALQAQHIEAARRQQRSTETVQPDGYVRQLGDAQAVIAHLSALGTLAIALCANPDPTTLARLEKRAAGMRRAGFDQPAVDLVRHFRKTAPDLFSIEEEMQRYAASLERLGRTRSLEDRLAEDAQAFGALFDALYGAAERSG